MTVGNACCANATGAASANAATATTNSGAYFTDSLRAVIYRVPADLGAAQTIPLTEDFELVAGFNLNGIDATTNGKTLVAVQTVTEAVHDLASDRRDAGDRPARRGGRERRGHPAAREDALRRPEPPQPARGREALGRPHKRPLAHAAGADARAAAPSGLARRIRGRARRAQVDTNRRSRVRVARAGAVRHDRTVRTASGHLGT
jgi:hypothetical protein